MQTAHVSQQRWLNRMTTWNTSKNLYGQYGKYSDQYLLQWRREYCFNTYLKNNNLTFKKQNIPKKTKGGDVFFFFFTGEQN